MLNYKFPYYKQLDAMDCGPTCLRMVAKHYKKNLSIQTLRTKAEIGKEGVSLLGIAQAAEDIGFKTLAVKVSFEKLTTEAPMPCIIHWQQNHFVVVYKITKSRLGKDLLIHVADPGRGLLTYSKDEFCQGWLASKKNNEEEGIALLLETTPRFYEDEGEKTRGLAIGMLWQYVWRYKSLLVQLGLGLMIGSILQVIFPFLTQSIVDTGIQTRNLHFIYLILIAQAMLFLGKVSVDFIRSWILLHISTRINLSILSDFLSKLLKLPIAFFDSKKTGDILQRIGDHHRIESFLTGSSLNVLFSMFNLVIFSFIAAFYNLTIFSIFIVSSILYTLWITVFLRYRRKMDNKRFALASQNQSSLIQLITGVQEIKMNNAEYLKRWEWENLQVKQFKWSIKSLAIGQYQQAGTLFINEGKNILITFLAATAVVNGQMTLGGMMAMQYIMGQLNSPIEQLIQFIQHWQDAQISIERLNEIHEIDNEEPEEKTFVKYLPQNKDIQIKNLSFTYTGAGNEPVLKDISLSIPNGKVTAIVGTSGSGKTTLLKLLLKFYNPGKGEIKLGDTALNNISPRVWRSVCGTVLQDGFIFSDTIANNIAVSDETPDIPQLLHAVKVANIQSFIEELPLSYNTNIGAEGSGISQGQKQRLLIARAVYKNPDFIFLDEATNALDANNESVIMQNLNEFFKGRTVVVVAHRLSTVKNADQIVVLEKGEIVETGTHAELTQKHGKYFELVKNQLELGN
ncbi:peptidase domain-containing ABC transporter [Emticicia sp. TH156]|uniref:peptidase domain-containing ABC transporter n=1 Tax=Emticicia sp. TH156 TaxID=2067454 RepID=UPI002101C373|nr:peptidase domain-containing ABC transporter [Emticicia sp. TH156]